MKNRIIGYDLARALALFGMVVVNFKIIMGAADNGPPWLVDLTGLLEGRAAATFVLLAGIGISLLSGKARRSKAPKATVPIRNTLLKRAFFLFVVGLLYTPVWPADILHFYGVYIAVAALLLTSSIRKLSILSFLLMVGFVVMFFAFNYEQEWNWKTLEYAGFWTPLGMIRNLFFNGFHPTIPWLSFLLIGMIIGRFDMNNLVVRRRVFWAGLVTALAAEITSWLLIHSLSAGVSLADQEAIEAIFGTKPMPPMPLYILAGGGCCECDCRRVCRDRCAVWESPMDTPFGGDRATSAYLVCGACSYRYGNPRSDWSIGESDSSIFSAGLRGILRFERRICILMALPIQAWTNRNVDAISYRKTKS
jgi:uncharacterized membrane protein